MYAMGQDPSGDFSSSLESLAEQYNEAINILRSRGQTVYQPIVEVRDLGPFGGNEAIEYTLAGGMPTRAQYADFVSEVEGMVSMASLTPTAEQSAALIAAGVTPQPPLETTVRVEPPAMPIYVVPTAVPSNEPMATPIIPNEPGTNAAAPLPTGVVSPMPSAGISPMVLIGAGLLALLILRK